jgi:hypothetical protein
MAPIISPVQHRFVYGGCGLGITEPTKFSGYGDGEPVKRATWEGSLCSGNHRCVIGGGANESGRLEERRVLVTHAERYIGPPVVELFREGAHVTADKSDYTDPATIQDVVEEAGRIDVLVANFAGPPYMVPVTNMLMETT